MKKYYLIITAVLVLATQSYAEKVTPPDAILKTLLTGVESNSVELFTVDGDARFRTAMTKELLTSVSNQLSARLKVGYTARYLGMLRQQGFDVHLYCLEFKDGGDDVLAKLSLKDSKVGGFWLQ